MIWETAVARRAVDEGLAGKAVSMHDQEVRIATDALLLRGDGILWRRWVRAMMLGELLGFAAPAIAGTIAYRSGFSNWWMFTTLVVAGSLEGAALGFAQSTVLNDEFDDFPRRAWIAATAVAAAVAWSLGMLPSSLGSFTEEHPAVVIAAAVVLAPVLLNSIGVAQWLVLRRLVPGATVWIPANAVAWLAGLPAVFVAMMVVPDGAPLPVRGVAGVISAVAMGGIVASITGIALLRLTNRHPRAQTNAIR